MKKMVIMSVSGVALVATVLAVCSGSARAAAFDDARADAAGIRKLSSKRLTLYTDLSGPEIDRLPAVFDRAFPQLCKYFGVKESDHADWRMTGCLMKDKARFAKAGLLPDNLPPFENGFSWGDVLWLYEQPSDYYRRHLLLHEGVHGFMNTVLGGCGPPWYMEGIAEYLATHRWEGGRLTLGYMPRNRDEALQWGRIRLVQDAVAEGRPLGLQSLIDFPPRAGETELYAWCWAAITLLDRHPRYQQRFRQLAEFVQEPGFNQRFYRLFDADWRELCEEWQLMTATLEYGYDVARSAIDFPKKPKKGSELLFNVHDAQKKSSDLFFATVAADRGWQNSGLRLEAGVPYRLTAAGRYQVAQEPKIWWCEPGGVSIRYYRGRPLGILLAAVRPDPPPADGDSALLHPTVVGLGTTLAPRQSGTLFLKINDSPGELNDNAGELKVEVRRQ
jgi:hypothetical protein